LKIACVQGKRRSELNADIAPMTTGTLEVPYDPAAGSKVGLTFRDAGGGLIDIYEFYVGPATPTLPTGVPPQPLTVKETDDTFVIGSPAFSWTFHRKQGTLGQVLSQGTPVLVGGSLYLARAVPGRLNPGEAAGKPAVVMAKEGENVRITVHWKAVGKPKQPEAAGTTEYIFQPDGSVELVTTFTHNAHAISLGRNGQLGVTAAPEYDTLTWERNSQWSVYPPLHVGRPRGRAPIGGEPNWKDMLTELNLDQDRNRQPVSQDMWEGMSGDFRSTKCNIYRAALLNKDGRGIAVVGDGTQHVRAVKERNGIRLLILDDYLGGSERHLDKSVKWPERRGKNGEALKVRLVLVQPSSTL
jgi:hypothetical protein